MFRKFKARLRLREAVKMADRAHSADGNRYYVMPVEGSFGRKLVVLDRRNFRIYKRKRYVGPEAKVFDLLRECFYFTPYRLGDKAISPYERKLKEIQYLDWVESDRKTSRLRKKYGKV